MKRFLRFDYREYYPSGGIGDLVDDFETLEDAQKVKPKQYSDILDHQTGKKYSWYGDGWDEAE